MLKYIFLLGCSLLISCAGTVSNTYSGRVVYSKDIAPPCIITFDNDYWTWRDAQGFGGIKESDFESIYSRYLKLARSADYVGFEPAFCNSELLFSVELARIMNAFGPNSSPWTLYYRVVTSLREGGNRPSEPLSYTVFRQLLISSIEEIERRFRETEAESVE